MKQKLLSIYLDLRSAFRKAIGSCRACGSIKDYWGENAVLCNYCGNRIKIK